MKHVVPGYIVGAVNFAAATAHRAPLTVNCTKMGRTKEKLGAPLANNLFPFGSSRTPETPINGDAADIMPRKRGRPKVSVLLSFTFSSGSSSIIKKFNVANIRDV